MDLTKINESPVSISSKKRMKQKETLVELVMTQNFVAFAVNTRQFKVVFTKQDGTLREMIGCLFTPDQLTTMKPHEIEGTLVEVEEAHSVRMWTDKGWRSFIKSSMVSCEVL
jgi:hypothetical protein